jgi:hypothetical protein
VPEIDITDWIENLSWERDLVAIERACRKLPEGFTSKEFEEALHAEYSEMCAADTIQELLDMSLIRADSVDEEGYVGYMEVTV